MPPRRVEPRFASTRKLVEPGSDGRPQDRKTGNEREKQRQRGIVERSDGRDQPDRGIEERDEDQVAALVLKIAPPFGERPAQVFVRDLAHAVVRGGRDGGHAASPT